GSREALTNAMALGGTMPAARFASSVFWPQPGSATSAAARATTASTRFIPSSLPSSLHLASPFEGASEGELVGVLEVAADGETAGDAGDLDGQRLQQGSQVHGGGVALDVGVGAQNHFGDALAIDAGQQ